MVSFAPARRAGFTLLEVMVAMSILALSLVAISGINANSFEASNYARGITVATLLARSKMIDIEMELEKDGFPTNDLADDGDFSEEGYPAVRWTATIREIKVDLSKFLAQLMGSDTASFDEDSMPDSMAAMLQAVRGDSSAESAAGQASADEVQQLMGGGMLETAMKQGADTLSKSIREIAIEVEWGAEHNKESIRFVQYVTTSGRISLAPSQGQKAAASAVTSGGRAKSSAVPSSAINNLNNLNRSRLRGLLGK